MTCCIIQDTKNADNPQNTFEKAGGIFVNIRAVDMGISEFNKVGDVIHEFTGPETLVKISTTFGDSLGEEMLVSVFVVDDVMLS